MRPPHVSFERVRNIFAAMQDEQINGVPLSELIGGGDPEQVASEILAVMARYIDLPSQDSILDVGCGCGRIATGLTQYLSPTSRYLGVDIVSGFVEFGKKFISSRYPNFRFVLLEEGNLTYDWWRQKSSQIDIAKLSEARPPGTVDLAISISLFTHLDLPAAADIMSAIARMEMGAEPLSPYSCSIPPRGKGSKVAAPVSGSNTERQAANYTRKSWKSPPTQSPTIWTK